MATKSAPMEPELTDLVKNPLATMRAQMCMFPYTTAASIGVGYYAGSQQFGSPSGRVVGGMMLGAVVGTGLALAVELSPTGIGGNYEHHEYEIKQRVVVSQMVTGALSGGVGALVAGRGGYGMY